MSSNSGKTIFSRLETCRSCSITIRRSAGVVSARHTRARGAPITADRAVVMTAAAGLSPIPGG